MKIGTRATSIFDATLRKVQAEANRVFFWVFLAQWVFAIALALILTPYAWTGGSRSLHFHVQLAVFGGAALNALPIALMYLRPAWWGTRHTVAITQMLWSALFIHLTGGRIETHFHIFVSLAFLAFYRDPRLLVTATLIVAADHLTVGFFWPESVYGISNPEWWRFLEHAGWVVFEDIVLFLGCVRALREMHILSKREATLDVAKQDVEQQVAERTQDLERSREMFRLIAESTKAAPFTLDLTRGCFPYVGGQAIASLGFTDDEWKQPGALDVIFPREHNSDLRTRLDECATGSFEFVATVLRSDGVRSEMRWSGTCELLSGAKSLRGLMQDITELRRLGRELAAAQKLESVGRLAAGVAHEINTPVQFVSDNVQFARASMTDIAAVILAYRALQEAAQQGGDVIEAAARAAQSETAAELDYLMKDVPLALEGAVEGLGRIATIVRSMKEFAHPDQAEKTLADLNQAIRSTLVIAHNEYKYVAEIDTQFGELPLVPCYLGEINQVVLNLIINASHAISDVIKDTGSLGKLTISTRFDADADAVEVAIADSGSGIPESARNQVFDPFFTTKEVGKGTGQGLAIARSVIVNKHGGTLRFETECGKGTTFFIRLPLNTFNPAETRVAA
jgi:PAS domain S-box-containing protein